MEKATADVRKYSFTSGVYLGLGLTVITTLIYSLSIDTLLKWWFGIIMFFIVISYLIYSVAKARKINGGYINFKQAFTSYFITILTTLVITLAVGILIFNVIDPEAAEYLSEETKEISRRMMERFGASESDIEAQLATMDGENQYSIGKQFQGFLWQVVIYSVFGLLIAAIMKRSDPNKA